MLHATEIRAVVALGTEALREPVAAWEPDVGAGVTSALADQYRKFRSPTPRRQ